MYDSNSFSMLFTVPNYHHQPYDEADVYSSYSSSPDSSAVDCTLSLGTPSTRLCDKKKSGFCGWNNLLKPNKQTQTHHQQAQVSKNGRGNGGDSMLERRCASCDTTSTPLWRNGPRGPKSLCNACGIRYKKEERRANAAASTASAGAPVEHQYILNNSWAAHHQNSPKYPYYNPPSGNEYSFMDGANHGDVDNGIPFLSWGLNVADRPSFVHY